MKLAPLKISLLPMRFILLFVYIFTNWYVYKFFIKPSLRFFPNLSYISLAIWIFIAIMWFWTYIIVCWLDAGSTKAELSRLSEKEREKVYDELKSSTCSKCELPKQERTHHCSKCNKCYNIFDHHCFIIGNCVAYRNAQPFVLFLAYGDLIFLYMCIVSIYSKTFYSKLNRSIAIFCALVFGALTYCLFVFMKLSYNDYVKGRTAYERVTNQINENNVRRGLKSIFPMICMPNPLLK